jgi:hypothetical protein
MEPCAFHHPHFLVQPLAPSMTTRHSLAIEGLLESLNAAARAEQFAL